MAFPGRPVAKNLFLACRSEPSQFDEWLEATNQARRVTGEPIHSEEPAMIAAANRFLPRTNRIVSRSTERSCTSNRPQRVCLERLRLAALADTTRFLNARLAR